MTAKGETRVAQAILPRHIAQWARGRANHEGMSLSRWLCRLVTSEFHARGALPEVETDVEMRLRALEMTVAGLMQREPRVEGGSL